MYQARSFPKATSANKATVGFNSYPGEGKKQTYLAHQHVTRVISDLEIGVAGE